MVDKGVPIDKTPSFLILIQFKGQLLTLLSCHKHYGKNLEAVPKQENQWQRPREKDRTLDQGLRVFQRLDLLGEERQ